jgi:CO/xanthine dehydrogenase FAD-binding subunit
LKSKHFLYPVNIEEASSFLLNYDDAIPLAGGTDLAILINKNVIYPTTFVDLTRLGLNYILRDEMTIHIGATTPICKILESPLVKKHLPVLSEAAGQLGSVQCRSVGTLGGNLCSAVPSADMTPPLLVLNAKVKLVLSNSSRIVPLDQFFISPRKTILKKGELLAELQIPLPSDEETGVFIKFGRRRAVTLSTVNVAVQLSICGQNKLIKFGRIALGAVAPIPVRAIKAESYLQGKEPLDRVFGQAAGIALTEIKPISDQRASAGYRSEISYILVKRALAKALELTSVTR